MKFLRISLLLAGLLSLFFSLISQGQNIGESGVYIRQNVVNDSIAKISVTTNLENKSNKRKTVVVRCGIWNNKEFITRDIQNVEINASAIVSVKQYLGFGMPELWSGPRHPFLYKLILEVMENGKITDSGIFPLGLRKFSFDSNNRFFLNHVTIPLYGVYLDDNDGYDDPAGHYQKLKDMLGNICYSGANAVFLPDKLQKDIVYSLCDSLGLIVWANFRNNLKMENGNTVKASFIHQNSNHPSIFFWSFGTWKWHDNRTLTADEAAGNEQLLEFSGLINKEDPERLTFHLNDVWWIPYDSIDKNQNIDRLHWYKSRWSEEPVIFIAGKKDTLDNDVLKKIWIYTNVYDPQLEVNGTIMDDRKEGTSEIEFSWENIILKKGMNRIRVFASKRGKKTEDTWLVIVR